MMTTATRVLDTLAVAAEGGGALPSTFFDVPSIFTGPVERVFFYLLLWPCAGGEAEDGEQGERRRV
uniref:Uncharacterized protein n=1 Tax=Aegilops tauschii subsp. strangulata TaxID=200361 RepID=A0A452ZH06_AEGTS